MKGLKKTKLSRDPTRSGGEDKRHGLDPESEKTELPQALDPEVMLKSEILLKPHPLKNPKPQNPKSQTLSNCTRRERCTTTIPTMHRATPPSRLLLPPELAHQSAGGQPSPCRPGNFISPPLDSPT